MNYIATHSSTGMAGESLLAYRAYGVTTATAAVAHRPAVHNNGETHSIDLSLSMFNV